MKFLIDNIEIIGQSKDSGYNSPVYLIRTPDGSFIQLTQLLFHTVVALKSETDLEHVAAKISDLEGKKISAKDITYLLQEKLSPLGLLAIHNTPDTQKVKTTEMLLGLKYRITCVPEKLVIIISKLLQPFFWTPIMIVVLGIYIGFSITLYQSYNVLGTINNTIYQPFLFILIFGLMIISSIFHEFGHATGCTYGGGKPGRIGGGIYLIWPAFFTDLTDVYRLSRLAKLRSDVGGIYFNVIFSLCIVLVYAITRFEPLLLVVILQNIEILHQLLPFLRLDGYFIISDIVGLPDLFNHVNPIAKSFLPGKRPQPIKHDLKKWVKWVVVIWMMLTIPVLFYFFSITLLNTPQVLQTALNSAIIQLNEAVIMLLYGNYFISVIRILQLIFLLLPPSVLLFVIFNIAKRIFLLIYTFGLKLLPVKKLKDISHTSVSIKTERIARLPV